MSTQEADPQRLHAPRASGMASRRPEVEDEPRDSASGERAVQPNMALGLWASWMGEPADGAPCQPPPDLCAKVAPNRSAGSNDLMVLDHIPAVDVGPHACLS